jgi:hypothetical protein
MQDQGMIKEEDRQQALKELQKITFQPSREALRSPHFVLWTKDQVERTFEGTDEKGLLEQGGLTIQTTLDWNLQKIAEATVAKFRDTVAAMWMFVMDKVRPSESVKRFVIGGSICVLFVLSYLTVLRTFVFEDSVVFNADILQKEPQDARHR